MKFAYGERVITEDGDRGAVFTTSSEGVMIDLDAGTQQTVPASTLTRITDEGLSDVQEDA